MSTSIRLATRGSRLAIWQANHVADLLRCAVPGLLIELVEIETAGDQIHDKALSQIGGEGVFTKEIQNAVLENRADVTVHSLKDLPTFTVDGLTLAAVPPRGPSGDVLVSKKHKSFSDLPQGAVVATSSVRRRAMLLYRRPDLKLVDIRGNVETRLRKLTEQDLDALVLAEAGLVRLGLQKHITEILDPQWMLPAVGQGALGLECRADDQHSRDLLAKIDHPPTAFAVRAERAMLHALGGGCQVPIGAESKVEGQTLTLRGAMLAPDGSWQVVATATGLATEGEEIGRELAGALKSKSHG